MALPRELYEKKVKFINKEIATARRVSEINEKLGKYNWPFVNPYNPGIYVRIFEEYLGENNSERKVFEVFARDFLNLKQTITFLEGYYKKRPYLQDYGLRIEESVVLCLQKDFSGAINLLLPVIEGTLRKYLISKKGQSAITLVNMSEIIKSLNYFSNDYVDRRNYGIEHEFKHLESIGQFPDKNQVKQMIKLERIYFELWVEQFRNYLCNNLYLNTKSEQVTDDLNRHNIFHLFDENVEFSFKNYLRLLNCINFLSWIIGITHSGCSIMPEAEPELVRKKWVQYLKVLITSEAMTKTKSEIYKKDIENYMPFINEPLRKVIGRSEVVIAQFLKANDVF